jgi:transketolase
VGTQSLSEAELCAFAAQIRRSSLQMAFNARLGHPGGDLSCADVLAVLYGRVLRFNPYEPNWPQRDRFVMSKGHAAASLYSTLSFSGYFPPQELATFMQPGSRLNGHPDRNKVPGVEANTGPLGHGLPISVGMALAARLDSAEWRVYVLTGDGELQEGSNWEAAMSAAHYRLSKLTVIVDRNRLQQGDWTEETVGLSPLADKWRAFGFEVLEVDGHDHAALLVALSGASSAGQPRCIIANTTKGRGVSFMEDKAAWHHKIPSADELEKALGELA